MSNNEPATSVAAAPRAGIDICDAAVARFAAAMVGALELTTVYLGQQLGLYDALRERGPATSEELAARVDCDERYIREWLEQQATAGLLEIEDGDGATRFVLPAITEQLLVDRNSPTYLGAAAQTVVLLGRPVPALVDAFRTGEPIQFDAYGDDARTAIAERTRPGYLHMLATAWLPALPDVHRHLLTAPAARIADIGCGSGWSTIALARAYPNARIDGVDADEVSIAAARRNAAEAGVADRVTFTVADAEAPGLKVGVYDLVVAFDVVHELAHPVAALEAARQLLAPGGAVLIADGATSDELTTGGGLDERLIRANSVLFCLPTARGHDHANTGAMRPTVLRSYVSEAGFRDVEEVVVAHPFWRFNRLTP